MTTGYETSDLNGSKRLDLPCLSPVGTKVFAPTADQRFLAGSAEFLRTHFPIQLQYRGANISSTVTEQDLLHRLLTPGPAVMGNRVFVLYGAAGSGKSELLRWLQTQIGLQDAARAAITVRISRTELDILHIVKCQLEKPTTITICSDSKDQNRSPQRGDADWQLLHGNSPHSSYRE